MADDSPAHIEAVDGLVTQVSRKKMVGMFFLTILIAAFGVFLVIGRWSEGRISITGIIFAALGGLAAPLFFLMIFFYKSVLIIGADRLQVGPAVDSLNTEIPYSNIESVKLVEEGMMSRVEIVLIDDRDRDTIYPSGLKHLRDNFKHFGYHLTIEGYVKSNESIRKAILKRMRAMQEGEDEDDRPRRKRRRAE